MSVTNRRDQPGSNPRMLSYSFQCPELDWFFDGVENFGDSSDSFFAVLNISRLGLREDQFFASLEQVKSLLVPLINRDANEMRMLGDFADEHHSQQVVAVLGDWWQGASRSNPLPPNITSLYWFERYRLPSVLGCLEQQRQPTTSLLISQDAQHRTAFVCTTPMAIALADSTHLPTAQLDRVVVDIDFSMTNLSGVIDLKSVFSRLRIAYPTAKIIVASSFPRWSLVKDLLANGADDVCGKPYELSALLRNSFRFS